MNIESRASLICLLRGITNFISFSGAIVFMIWFLLILNISQAEFVLTWVPAYALFSTFFDWISSKLNADWFKGIAPNSMLKRQELTIEEFKLYLDLVLKFRLIRTGIGCVIALIAFMFSFYPLLIFTLFYLVSYIAILCYFDVMNIKIPEELKMKPSSDDLFARERIENNSAIIGTAANSMSKH